MARKTKDYSDREVLDVILNVLETHARAMRKQRVPGITALAAHTMAALTAAKLMLLLQRTAGTTYDPAAWELIEQASDDLASDVFVAVFQDFRDSGIPGLRLKGERSYLHLVRNREGFRWCPTQIAPEERTPFEPDLLPAVAPLADPLTFEIMDELAALRRSNPPTHEFSRTLAETTALMGLAKLHLAVWGNDKRAAAFESIADMVSAQYLKDLGPSINRRR